MSNFDVVAKYYEGWATGQFDRDWFTEDFTFHGPLAQCTNVDELMVMIEQMAQMVTVEDMDVIAQFANEENQACVIYDFITSAPIESKTRCAEMFTLEDGKIKAINLVYDAREWEKAMLQA